MNGQIDRLAEILKLSDGLNGAELRELGERIVEDPATKQKLFWQEIRSTSTDFKRS